MKWVWRWIVSAAALLIVAYLFEGIRFDSLGSAFVAALVLGLINTFIRPIIQLLTLPVTLVTLGLFSLVINAVMLLVTTAVVSGFYIDTFWTALWGSIVLAVVSGLLGLLLED